MLSIAESTITSKNQTTIPQAVVKALGVKPTDKLVFEIEDGKVTVSAKAGRLAELAGMLKRFERRRTGPPPTVEEMDAAIRNGAAEAHRRSGRASGRLASGGKKK